MSLLNQQNSGIALVLREIIIKAIKGDSVCEQKLIKQCADFAEAYLRMRTKKDARLFSLISSSSKDLAMDCIAELFETRQDKLIVLEKYFSNSIEQTLKPSEYHTLLRRLVFSKVNETLYNYYRSFDPSLGKIIRNIKRVFKEEEIPKLAFNSETALITLKEKDENNLPLMPYDLIERKLAPNFKSSLSTRDILIKLALIFEGHDYYRTEIKITLFAEVIRRLHQFYAEDEHHFNFSEHEDIRNKELQKLINHSVKKVQIDLHSSYVAKKKVSDEDYSKYFLVAEKVLTGDYVHCIGNGKSYYEHFSEIVENVSKEEYRNNHRQYVEYFVKIARLSFIQTLKNEE